MGDVMMDTQQDFSNENVNKVKEINKLLTSEKHKIKALQLVSKFIPTSSKEDFTDNCINWMQFCCRSNNSNESELLSLQTLNLLIYESAKHPEINKSVAHFLSSRFFGKFFKNFINLESGWKCVESCFSYYRGPCGAHQENIKKNILVEFQKNSKVSTTVSKVYALLPGVGEAGNNGINYRTKWKNQFEHMLNICQSILKDLFTDVVELQTYDDAGYEKYCEAEFKDEVHLYFLFHNYCSVLENMLLCKYPVMKTIVPEKVFDLVCRCLNVSSKTLGNRLTTQSLKLSSLLPLFHKTVHSLLRALIVTSKAHLLPYSQLISKLIKQSFQSVEATSEAKSHDELRIAVYDTLSNWLTVSKGASCAESISNTVVRAVLSDTDTKELVVTLKDGKTGSQVQDEKQQKPISEELCCTALKCLQTYLREVGCLIKPELHMELHLYTLKLLLNIQNTSTVNQMPPPYQSSKCRLELYSVLLSLVNYPSPKCPPPTHWSLRLFSKGIQDQSIEISSYCSLAQGQLLNIIHPEFNAVTMNKVELPENNTIVCET